MRRDTMVLISCSAGRRLNRDALHPIRVGADTGHGHGRGTPSS
jgi:hypothetical protein